MIYLFLCIISSTIILLLFKYLERHNIDVFQTIVVNYLTAAFLGIITSQFFNSGKFDFDTETIPFAFVIGLLFIVVFFLIARSTKYAGVSTTSVATKMSVVIPVIFSILRYNESLDIKKAGGILIALTALYLTVKKNGNTKHGVNSWLFPILIFFGTGIIDTTIKFSQAEHIKIGGIGAFNTVVFSVSFVIGLIIFLLSFKKQIKKFKPDVIFAGIVLGIANFGSLFFLISALNTRKKVLWTASLTALMP